jgi:hypothetical protein
MRVIFLVVKGDGDAKLGEKVDNWFKREERYVGGSGFALWRWKETPFSFISY